MFVVDDARRCEASSRSRHLWACTSCDSIIDEALFRVRIVARRRRN
jgi:hypothetical protein